MEQSKFYFQKFFYLSKILCNLIVFIKIKREEITNEYKVRVVKLKTK